jgi:hypothetical protein
VAISVGSVSVDVVPDARRFVPDLRPKLSNLPKVSVQVEAATAQAEAALGKLGRNQTATLNVNADTAAAAAAVSRLSRNQSATVNVDADTGKAEAELARVAQDRTANIRVDDQGSILSSTNRLGALLTAGVALGPAIVPAAAAAAAAVGAIGVGALAGVAGIGTLVLGFSGVGDAVKALGAAQTSAGRDAAKSAASQVAAAEQIRSAEASLANVRANSGDSAVRSARAVADAQQGVRDATREAARSVQDALGAQATAQRGVEDAARAAAASVRSALQQQVEAHRAVEDATRAASRSVADALFAQENAEQSLAQAQRDARTAQLSLTQAREDARQSLEDLTLQVEDGALAQRRAVLSVQDAQDNLNQTLANPKATERQRQQAQLSYDEAVQNLDEISVRNDRLAKQKADADKAGINGSKQVQAATAGIATAEQRVQDARTQAARAADATTQARVAGEQSVAQARQRAADADAAVTEAQRAGDERVLVARQALAKAEQGVADARVAGDRKVADAQQRVSDAQASQASAAAGVGVRDPAGAGRGGVRSPAGRAGREAQSTSLSKVDDAMKALSPAGKTFALFLFSLRHRFDELKATAQEGLLPGVQAGIESVLPLLPRLERIVGNAAKAMGDLFEQAGKALTSPFWKSFFDMIERTVGPNLTMFGTTLGNVATGFAGLLMAFEPLNAQLGKGLLDLSTRFAEFGKGAAKNEGFQAFLDYVQRVGPLVWHVIETLAITFGHIAVALAPLGPIVLQSIGFLLDVINRIPINVLTVLAVAIGGLVVGFRLFSAAVWLVNIAMNANPSPSSSSASWLSVRPWSSPTSTRRRSGASWTGMGLHQVRRPGCLAPSAAAGAVGSRGVPHRHPRPRVRLAVAERDRSRVQRHPIGDLLGVEQRHQARVRGPEVVHQQRRRARVHVAVAHHHRASAAGHRCCHQVRLGLRHQADAEAAVGLHQHRPRAGVQVVVGQGHQARVQCHRQRHQVGVGQRHQTRVHRAAGLHQGPHRARVHRRCYGHRQGMGQDQGRREGPDQVRREHRPQRRDHRCLQRDQQEVREPRHSHQAAGAPCRVRAGHRGPPRPDRPPQPAPPLGGTRNRW